MAASQDLETDSRNFELEYKKIAFRDIDSAEFYRKENDQFKRIVSMSSMPTDLSTYFVKVKSSESKEMLLPVHSIAESHKDGRDVYKVTVSLPELVQEGETGYKSGYDFYISKAVPSQQNVYTSFAGLIDAMKKIWPATMFWGLIWMLAKLVWHLQTMSTSKELHRQSDR